jgi:hypothetical protein
MLAAVGRAALGPLPLNPMDTGFALDWGRELARGGLPGVYVANAPTPHPLSIVEGMVASLAGSHALDAMQAMILVATGVLALMVWQIGSATRMSLAGLIGAAILLTDPYFLLTGVGRASPDDIPALAAVMAAIYLELRSPKRGSMPLGLLLLAGLWRPETWPLSFAYAIHCGRGRPIARKLKLAALSLAAPVIWLLSDLALTGNPLYSLFYTRWATSVAERPTGASAAPTVLWHTLTSYYGVPTLVCAALGIVVDLRYRLMPRIVIVWAAVTVGAFVVVGAMSLPVLARYAMPCMVATALYAGIFLAGWTRLAEGPLRDGWQLTSVVGSMVILLALVGAMTRVRDQRHSVAELGRMDRDLIGLTTNPNVRSSLFSCGALQTSYQVVPLLAFDLGRSTEAVVRVNEGLPTSGVFIEPAHSQALFDAELIPPRVLGAEGFTVIAHNSDWLAFRRCQHAIATRQMVTDG